GVGLAGDDPQVVEQIADLPRVVGAGAQRLLQVMESFSIITLADVEGADRVERPLAEPAVRDRARQLQGPLVGRQSLALVPHIVPQVAEAMLGAGHDEAVSGRRGQTQSGLVALAGPLRLEAIHGDVPEAVERRRLHPAVAAPLRRGVRAGEARLRLWQVSL